MRPSNDPNYLRLQRVRFAQQLGVKPAAHAWQADVETAHRLIEDEFYEVESFSSRSDFLAKATTYNLWFNTLRKNSYKQHRSPWKILHDRDPSLPKRILTFPPRSSSINSTTNSWTSLPQGDTILFRVPPLLRVLGQFPRNRLYVQVS